VVSVALEVGWIVGKLRMVQIMKRNPWENIMYGPAGEIDEDPSYEG
jgi:hypothetical protein